MKKLKPQTVDWAQIERFLASADKKLASAHKILAFDEEACLQQAYEAMLKSARRMSPPTGRRRILYPRSWVTPPRVQHLKARRVHSASSSAEKARAVVRFFCRTSFKD